MRVRPADRTDPRQLRALYRRASARSTYFRFCTPNRVAADRYLATLVRPQTCQHRMLAAYVHDELVGVAGFDRVSSTEVEASVLVADAHQRHGIGTLLVERLASIAAGLGIRSLIADVPITNVAAIRLALALDAGYDVYARRSTFGVTLTVRLPPSGC